MEVRELIARCTRDREDTEAWMTLCRLMETVAMPAIRRMMRCRNVAAFRAEDILQELYVAVLERELHPLPMFQGTCAPQLQAFLRTIALRFAGRTLQRWQRQRCLESAAVAERSYERGGPTEHEVRAAWEELDRLLTDEDRAKLRALSPPSSPRPWASATDQSRAIPPRTLRHWRQELCQKYADRIM